LLFSLNKAGTSQAGDGVCLLNSAVSRRNRMTRLLPWKSVDCIPATTRDRCGFTNCPLLLDVDNPFFSNGTALPDQFAYLIRCPFNPPTVTAGGSRREVHAS